jgi:hypothetical protein
MAAYFVLGTLLKTWGGVGIFTNPKILELNTSLSFVLKILKNILTLL